MLACNKVTDRPPHAFIDGDNGRELHQMLNRCDGFQVAGMEIQIAIADGKDCSATAAHQPPRAPKQMLGVIRRTPRGTGSAADAALECRKNLRNWLCHD